MIVSRSSQEEGRESDEEDDFGLIEMADESVPIGTGRRFEDSDPDSTFIDANVLLENLDDFDRTGGYEISRPERLSASEVALHPLMHRASALGTETNALRNGLSVDLFHFFGYRLTISGRRPGTVTAPVLHRQDAVRRWCTVGPQRDILERLIESGTVANAAHLFDVLPSRQRLFNIIVRRTSKAGMLPKSVRSHSRSMLCSVVIMRLADCGVSDLTAAPMHGSSFVTLEAGEKVIDSSVVMSKSVISAISGRTSER
ncbi:unnamed protein product [Toxocara canis]|uniref:Non-structural protein NS1 n=1 Tax=Toxocara canis TaxID=6265 RepID=A0A183U3L7_TOXCA|nr:unnamed protein product [Toxocara canis]